MHRLKISNEKIKKYGIERKKERKKDESKKKEGNKKMYMDKE